MTTVGAAGWRPTQARNGGMAAGARSRASTKEARSRVGKYPEGDVRGEACKSTYVHGSVTLLCKYEHYTHDTILPVEEDGNVTGARRENNNNNNNFETLGTQWKIHALPARQPVRLPEHPRTNGCCTADLSLGLIECSRYRPSFVRGLSTMSAMTRALPNVTPDTQT